MTELCKCGPGDDSAGRTDEPSRRHGGGSSSPSGRYVAGRATRRDEVVQRQEAQRTLRFGARLGAIVEGRVAAAVTASRQVKR